MGLALRLMRARHGWTQEELARRSGVGKARISGYENGTTQPTLETLDRLLRTLQSNRFSLFLLAELLAPATGAVAASAELAGEAGAARTDAVWQAMLGALRSNHQTLARLLDALERCVLDPPAAGEIPRA